MNEDCYREALKELSQRCKKLTARYKYAIEHGIEDGPLGIAYQLRHASRDWNRLVSFMDEHGISIIKKESDNGKPDP